MILLYLLRDLQKKTPSCVYLCIKVYWLRQVMLFDAGLKTFSKPLLYSKGLWDKGVQLSQNGDHANIHYQILLRYKIANTPAQRPVLLLPFNDINELLRPPAGNISILLQFSPRSVTCIQESGSIYRFSWP